MKRTLSNILCFAVLLSLQLSRGARAELTADNLVLIVNGNVPESAELARFYAEARKVPAGRICALDLPFAEEMAYEDFDRLVRPQVRKFIEDAGLRERATCLVAFYGLPLRIRARQSIPEELAELAALRASIVRVGQVVRPVASDLEVLARQSDVNFQALPPAQAEGVDGMARRVDRAIRSIAAAAEREGEPKRSAIVADLEVQLRRLKQAPPPLETPANVVTGGPAATTTSPTAQGPGAGGAATPTRSPNDPALRDEDIASMAPANLSAHRDDLRARRRLRELAAAENLVSYARVLAAQIGYLGAENTDSALDNELALIWWPVYERSQWQANSLHWRFQKVEPRPPTVMVARLDAPTPQQVRDIIANSLRVEREGLAGKLVVDAGGAVKLDPSGKQPTFRAFDQLFQRLAEFARGKTSLQVVFDEGPEVIPPQPPVRDVALYTGWYSVGNYVGSFAFSPGAVGYHVASYELTTLRDPNNKGWCRGLLNDGVVATLGPVSEPYLHAFPQPDEFFALLLTGKLTLAEVYWRTNPLTSWKIALLGDPLYTPYRTAPAVQPAALPADLRAVIPRQDR